jgi:heme exporter protein D
MKYTWRWFCWIAISISIYTILILAIASMRDHELVSMHSLLAPVAPEQEGL